MTYATYTRPVPAHSTRTGKPRTQAIKWLVIHTSEGGEMPTSAEALVGFISSPRSATNLASYHYIVDTDRVIPVVPDGTQAYAAGGGNNTGLHICHPGRAAQTRDDWFDANSGPQLEQVARWLADKTAEYGIPLEFVNAKQVGSGVPGVCGHNEISLAFKMSTHTDPGKGYPWDWVIVRARQLSAPLSAPPTQPSSGGEEEEDEVQKLLVRADDGLCYITDLVTYAHWCTEDEGANLRDNRDVTTGPGNTPAPLNAIDSTYVRRMAGVAP